MLAINLAFVGAALFLNGILPLIGENKKQLASINVLVGIMIVTFNFFQIFTAKSQGEYINYFSGLLFGFTNLLIASESIWDYGRKTLGWYSLFCMANAVVLSVFYIYSGKTILGVLWAVWLFIWLFAFLSDGLKINFEKPAYYMYIFQGLLTTYGVGILMLMGILKL